MYPFTPSRRVSYIALSAVVIAAIAILYRRLAGNDPIALALGVVAVLLGIVAVTLLYGEWWQQYRRVLSGSVRYRRLGRRGRIIGIVGAILVFGSFAWLRAAIAIFGASPQHILLLQFGWFCS